MPPPPPKGYVVPDVSDSLLSGLAVRKRDFSLTFGISLLVDYTAFEQDDASVAQVGVQENTLEIREARLSLSGHFNLFGTWRYQLTGQFNGFDREPFDGGWTVNNVHFTRDLGPTLAQLTFGKVKEAYGYEMLGGVTNEAISERLLTPFFTSRDIGVTLTNTFLDQRATWSLGWFNDWWTKDVPFSESGQQVAARLTALPLWEKDSKRYLHVGLAMRYNGADENQLRFSGRPESNPADIYEDTDVIPSDHAWHVGLEGLWADGPFSVLAEYVQAWVSSSGTGDPSFNAWYVQGNWVVTGGGPRPYDRKAGLARRIHVAKRGGDVELVARFGVVDLDDAGVRGGTLDKWYAGINWWATSRWKAGFGYGNAELERFDTSGRTQIFFWRLQWIH